MRILTFLVLALAAKSSFAGIVFNTNPNGSNSTAWSSAIASQSGIVNSSADFEAHPLGALDSSFYSSEGLTINSSVSTTVATGSGPGESNVFGQLPGEGVNSASRHLQLTGNGVLTLTFDSPVIGAGLFTIDKFTSSTITLDVFDGPNATGSLLATSGAVGSGANFQQNILYFVGVHTDAGEEFSSLRLTFTTGASDAVAFDNIQFATAVPEPSSLMCMGAVGGLALLRRRRR